MAFEWHIDDYDVHELLLLPRRCQHDGMAVTATGEIQWSGRSVAVAQRRSRRGLLLQSVRQSTGPVLAGSGGSSTASGTAGAARPVAEVETAGGANRSLEAASLGDVTTRGTLRKRAFVRLPKGDLVCKVRVSRSER